MAFYESLLPEIIPMVPGCPDTLIETTIRASVIEMCERGGLWQEEIVLSTTASTYDYTITPPSGAVVHKVMSVVFNGLDLEPISAALLDQRKPKWRDTDHFGKPEYFLMDGTELRLVPVPDQSETNSIIARVQLKPTITSSETVDRLITDYRDLIVNGAVFRLLRLPSKEWTDYTGAQVYGSLFNQGLIAAERRARHADTGVARKVRYGGLHSSSRKRNRYGRETL